MSTGAHAKLHCSQSWTRGLVESLCGNQTKIRTTASMRVHTHPQRRAGDAGGGARRKQCSTVAPRPLSTVAFRRVRLSCSGFGPAPSQSHAVRGVEHPHTWRGRTGRRDGCLSRGKWNPLVNVPEPSRAGVCVVVHRGAPACHTFAACVPRDSSPAAAV